MSVLMFVNLGGDGRWPTDVQIDRFRASGRPVAVFEAHGPQADGWSAAFDELVDVVAAEFRRRPGHHVRLVLTGFEDAVPMAARLYRDRGVPVNVVFSAVDVDASRQWPAELRTADGVTACSWNQSCDADDVVATVLDFVDSLADKYRWYVNGLRDVQTAAAGQWLDNAVLDRFGNGLQAVEIVLDIVLEQVCGDQDDDDDDDVCRWTSADVVVEYGDVAAENARRLTSPPWNRPPEIVADYLRRVARVTTSFGASFWRDSNGGDGRPCLDRVLAACLVQNIRDAAAATKLADLSTEQFAACLNAKFIATRNWQRLVTRSATETTAAAHLSSLFRPEIRDQCHRFLAVDHLLDLLDDRSDGVVGNVFGRSHVEHLEPYVLPQRLVEYAARHYRHQVRYFALTDTLVFRFSDCEPGHLIQTDREHRFAGPANFKEYHDEMFRVIDYASHDDGMRPLLKDHPNAFVYRDCGYAGVDDHGLHYVSSCGGTTVRAEVQELRQNSGGRVVWQRHLIRVVRGGFWATVHRVVSRSAEKIGSRDAELTVGTVDGHVIAVTRRPVTDGGGFDVVTRSVDGSEAAGGDRDAFDWPVLEGRMDGSAITVTVPDGTLLTAYFYNDDDDDDWTGARTVCKVNVSDATRIRTRTGSGAALQYYRRNGGTGRPATAGAGDKYLVCRRDMSGYEFVHDSDGSETDGPAPDFGTDGSKPRYSTDGPPPTNVVRTLTRSHLTDRTAALLDHVLTDHLKTIESLAQRLNASVPKNAAPEVSVDTVASTSEGTGPKVIPSDDSHRK